ncbi:DUF3570 domain-containing protein [Colwelliaceae bacterium BS250]
MQLIDGKSPVVVNTSDQASNLKTLLTAAACSLLGTTAQANEDNSWQFDTALMYYGETDRVTAVEGIVAGSKEFQDEHFLNLKLTVDSLTGASATGAVAQPNVQTFTRPSGEGIYQVAPGETPLDDTFKDTRVQLNASWTQPISENYSISTGAHLSKEYDYLSLGINGSIARDFNKKNTTVAIGAGYFYDEIEPEGGIPRPLAQLPEIDFTQVSYEDDGEIEFEGDEIEFEDDEYNPYRIASKDDKTTIDLLIGVTQVINRQMIMQLNYSYSQVDGYLTDPFKIVSVVDNNGISQHQIYEHRPDSRSKQSVFLQTKYHFSRNVLDFSYRYLWDDWEINSHTMDMRYRIPLGSGYIEPHVRYYMQEAAEFYRPFILTEQVMPEYVSADYRIGEMTALTVGFKYGLPLKNNQEISFRIEYYQQTPENPGYEEVGVLADLELFESVEAIIAQISYSF